MARVAGHPAPDSSVPVEELIRLPGGEIATAMVACARLGCRAAYVGRFGSNADGAEVADALRREGVDLSYARHVDGPNRLAIILVDHAGRRTVLWSRSPALQMRPADIDPSAVTSGSILLVDAMDPDASTAAAAHARAAGVRTAIDIDAVRPGVGRLLRTIDVIIASQDFVGAFTGAESIAKGLNQLAADSGASLVVATMGAAGSLALFEGGEIQTPAFPVDVVDTTGAGDAFRGGFLAGWVQYGASRSVPALLEIASAVAALNCRALGAQAGLPQWSAVDVLVTRTTGVRSN